MIGCAIQTGVGAVLNTAKVEEGATVLVTGLGGIGLSIVQGARIAGASRIIVSDPVAERRDHAWMNAHKSLHQDEDESQVGFSGKKEGPAENGRAHFTYPQA